MTKRVESLRAPCLDASSTLATSTKRRILVRLFLCRWLGRSVGGVSGDLSTVGRCLLRKSLSLSDGCL